MNDKPRIVTTWLAQAWKWSLLLGGISVMLWFVLPLMLVLAIADWSWWWPGGVALLAFGCTVLVQGLRVAVICAICLQTIAGYDAPKTTDEAPPIAGAGG